MINKKWAGLAVVGLIAGNACGAGFQLYTEGSAEALGQAGAVSGRTNLISLAWYNPSGLAGTERPAIMIGSTLVSIRTDFSSDNGAAFDSSMDDDWRVVPHLYYVQPINEKITGMLSINAPYGLITEWDSGWIGNMAAISSDLEAVFTTPSVAYRISDAISVSLGFNVVYSTVELTADRDLTAVVGYDFGQRTIEGTDLSWGYTASGHWKITDDWALGARYQSRVELEFEGDATLGSSPNGVTTYDVDGDLTLPATLNFGVANTSVEKLSLGLDFVWSEWSTYDQLLFNFGSGYPLTNPDLVEKRWNDVWSVRLGGEYQLSDGLALRAGYAWDQSPVESDTRAPELPGADRQMLLAGLGWKIGNFGLDLAYSFLWVAECDTGSEVNTATSGATAGSYDTTTHLLGVSGSYMF